MVACYVPAPKPMWGEMGYDLTVSDYFCGAGGSSSGLEQVPGLRVVTAVNHWRLAIDTHNLNLPHADHDTADLSEADPRRYATTDIGWFSPACTFWSQARGERCDFDSDHEQLKLGLLVGDDEDPDDLLAEEAKVRSRMLMRDVLKFTRYHRYKAVIVENVPDILKWVNLDSWLREFHVEGYKHKIVTLNSAFASLLGDPACQLRDRVFVVFWQERYPEPNWDKWLRPAGWCPSCGDVVRAVFTAKPGRRRPMRYGRRAQYVYRCPKMACRQTMVHPYVLPALAAVDLSIYPGKPIGERTATSGPDKRIVAATRERIRAGLARYGRPIVAEVAGHTFERRPGVRTRPVDMPLTTQHTTAAKAPASHPLLVPTGGTWRDDASSTGWPMPTRTARDNDAVVVPPFLTVLRSGRPRTVDLADPFATVVADGSGHALVNPLIVPVESRDGQRARPAEGEPLRALTGRHQDALVLPLRNNGVARPVDTHTLVTVAAGGHHNAILMRNNNDASGGASMSTPMREPMRTLTTKGHQSVVQFGDACQYNYDTGLLRPLTEPLPAQTTVEGDAVLVTDEDVDRCTLRMLVRREVQKGMDFPDWFAWLPKTSSKNAMKMLGNAVTPCSSRDLGAAIVETITGVEIEPTGLALVS